MLGAFKRMFGGKAAGKSSFSRTKVTRKFGPDGQLVEEVVETEGDARPGDAAAARQQASKADEFFKSAGKALDEAFGKIDEAFDKLFSEPTDQE